MTTKKVSNSVVSVVATTAGALSSKIVADAIPLDNAKIKHGLLAAVAIAGAAFLTRKDEVSAFAQDVAIGVGATQVVSLVKELVTDPKGAFKIALGNPYDEYSDNVFLASPTGDYDFIPTEQPVYQEQPLELGFRV